MHFCKITYMMKFICTYHMVLHVKGSLGNNMQLIETTKMFLQQGFKIKDLGELKFFLGMEFSRSNKGIFINQRKYVQKIISDLGLGRSKPTWAPLEANVKLIVPKLDQLVGITGDQMLEDAGQYQKLIGKLLYLIMSRPDTAFSVQTLSQFM
ncbi:uncharacterized mitochondrial protein AtMg00810-like [Nicotiana sylvestris]|uniref:uncharacterized mitochondrial protein AtMg00810-like n=1 Tax=Nicotiana sylvestris TaxID=4096 RepID=UPI00388C8103